jgi:hypothetical protein
MLLKCFVIDFKWEGGSQRIYRHAENRTKAFEDASKFFIESFGVDEVVPENFTVKIS